MASEALLTWHDLRPGVSTARARYVGTYVVSDETHGQRLQLSRPHRTSKLGRWTTEHKSEVLGRFKDARAASEWHYRGALRKLGLFEKVYGRMLSRVTRSDE